MPNYGFLIDQRKCIGCHACSVACKAENQVPLGVNRTWVKYVEAGSFPQVRRHFQVTRCNHCANPPCVRICPVTAMYQRADGIVEFDPGRCIGCKACLQACPYDAIYIDPDSHTAAKCHYCSHRTDLGLQPACVIFCPTQAIVAGDLDDPASEISRLVAREPVSVRRPEQGTAPKLFYIDADEVTLTPTAPTLPPTLVWADLTTDQAAAWAADFRLADLLAPAQAAAPLGAAASPAAGRAPSGTPLRAPQPQGLGQRGGPITIGDRWASHMVQTAYTAQHKIPWHWPVPAYLLTKGIGAGAALVLPLAAGLGLLGNATGFVAAALLLALIFLGLTTGLLVFDLERPERFLNVILHPQWRSWLTRGAFLLIGLTAVAGIWLLVEGAAALGLIEAGTAISWRGPLAILTFPLALATAVYTGFLFAQAEGRDLWQSPLLPFHLSVQAMMVGAGALWLLDLAVPAPVGLDTLLGGLFALALLVDLFVLLVGEFSIPHASETAARAAHMISHGRYRGWFWGGGIALGHLLPLALIALIPALGTAGALGGLAALGAGVGLFAYEYAFVMAPQAIPNS